MMTTMTATADATATLAPDAAMGAGAAVLTAGRAASGGSFSPEEQAGHVEVSFAEGLIGIPDARRFVFEASEEIDPLLRMRCVDRPGFAFLLVDPKLLLEDYAPKFSDETRAAIGLAPGDEGLVRAIVSISPVIGDCGANLLAPILINPKSMRGTQVILDPPAYSVRHPLT